MMKHARLVLTLVLGVTLFGATASAQLLEVTGSANVNGTASSDQATTAADASVNAGASAGAREERERNSDSSLELSIKRSTLDADTDYSVSNADLVRSSASLESYASATVRADEHLESIRVADGRMDMKYRTEAKLLSVLPTRMTIRISVNETGEIAVRYPWYAFVMKTAESRADLEARLAAEMSTINTSVGTTGTASVSNADIRRWARIIDRVYVTISGHTATDVRGEAEG